MILLKLAFLSSALRSLCEFSKWLQLGDTELDALLSQSYGIISSLRTGL